MGAGGIFWNRKLGGGAGGTPGVASAGEKSANTASRNTGTSVSGRGGDARRLAVVAEPPAGGQVFVVAVAAVAIDGGAELRGRAGIEKLSAPRIRDISEALVRLIVGIGSSADGQTANRRRTCSCRECQASSRAGNVRRERRGPDVIGKPSAILGEVHRPGRAHLADVRQTHLAASGRRRVLPITGKSNEMSIAMSPITTRSSVSVNP